MRRKNEGKQTHGSVVRKQRSLRVWLAFTVAFIGAPAGYAQNAPASSGSRPQAKQLAQSGKLRFDIPPQSLPSALSAFREASNLPLQYDAALTQGMNTEGVSGSYTPEQALRILLAGTGLTARFTEAGPVTLERAGASEYSASGEGPLQLSNVVVTATRGLGNLGDAPRAATVIEREQIKKQTALSSSLQDMLGNLVPGMGPSSEGLSNSSQTLRGRTPFVLIDGIPQTMPLRNGRRDLSSIDPSAIERIEVLRGASAVYGLGSGGGIINIITKRPGAGPAQLNTKVTLGVQPTNVGETFRKRLVQNVSGKNELFDYNFSASAEQTGGWFDGEGDRIPPVNSSGHAGMSDSNIYNIFGKAGFDLTKGDRLEFSANYYSLLQDADHQLVSGVAGEEKATTVKGDELGKGQHVDNLNASIKYTGEDILGSRVRAQLYYRDHEARFLFFPNAYLTGGQSFLDSQRIGSRLDIETPVTGGKLLWGVDLLNEKTSQPLEDGRFFVPEMEQNTLGPFLQAEFYPSDNLSVSGGIRFEQIWFDVDDFTTVFNNSVDGGKLDYNETLFNLGAVFYLTDALNGFASFSQGFSVPEIGRVLRNAADGTSVADIRPQAQVVDNYEIGLRGNWTVVQSSFTLFFSESDLGASLSAAPAGEPIRALRSPERIYGVEGTLDVQPTANWGLGGTVTWMEGKRDGNDNGTYESYLPGDRIPPLKVTGYIENQTLSNWHNRLQVLYSGNRNRFAGQSGFGRGEVNNFVLVDLISNLELGNLGSLRLGVKNLLNEQYFPVISQVFNFDDRFTAGRGRTINLTYSFDW